MAGKSTLARRLSAELDARLIEADLFLATPSTYVESLAIDCLNGVLNERWHSLVQLFSSA